MNEVNFPKHETPINATQSTPIAQPKKLKPEQTNCLLLIFKLIGKFFSDLVNRLRNKDTHKYTPIKNDPKTTGAAQKVIEKPKSFLTEAEKSSIKTIFIETGGIENSDIKTVRKLVQDEAGNKFLTEFAKKCYQNESVEFLNEIAEFNKDPTAEKYKEIHGRFIKPGSPQEINLSDGRPSETVDPKVFEDPEQAKKLLSGPQNEIEKLLNSNLCQRMGEFITFADEHGVLPSRQRS